MSDEELVGDDSMDSMIESEELPFNGDTAKETKTKKSKKSKKEEPVVKENKPAVKENEPEKKEEPRLHVFTRIEVGKHVQMHVPIIEVAAHCEEQDKAGYDLLSMGDTPLKHMVLIFKKRQV